MSGLHYDERVCALIHSLQLLLAALVDDDVVGSAAKACVKKCLQGGHTMLHTAAAAAAADAAAAAADADADSAAAACPLPLPSDLVNAAGSIGELIVRCRAFYSSAFACRLTVVCQ